MEVGCISSRKSDGALPLQPIHVSRGRRRVLPAFSTVVIARQSSSGLRSPRLRTARLTIIGPPTSRVRPSLPPADGEAEDGAYQDESELVLLEDWVEHLLIMYGERKYGKTCTGVRHVWAAVLLEAWVEHLFELGGAQPAQVALERLAQPERLRGTHTVGMAGAGQW